MDVDGSFRKDLLNCYMQSSSRGLKQSAKWAAELLHSIGPESAVNRSADISGTLSLNASFSEQSFVTPPTIDIDFFMAKSCFDLNEYDRAAFFAKGSSTREGKFLYYYSRYMAAEKKRLDLLAETSANGQMTTPSSSVSMDVSLSLFHELRRDLNTKCDKFSEEFEEDSYVLYVYAIVLLKMDLNEEALNALVQSLKVDPTNWASWHQLAHVVEDKDCLDSLDLPTHWFKRFFLGVLYIELQLNEEALDVYDSLITLFPNSNYILTQIAIAQNNLRDVDSAIEIFRRIRVSDPFRLDGMDVYSNILYVKDMRADLSSLAHAFNSIDPFRVETCCTIANFYSLRGQHAKAVVYFSRALQLNPKHLSAWTLMGHEYMEMKNTGAAIQAYRSAIKCNKRDYRAWYGLGQTYEILKMNSYCLYYYTIARSLNPNDPRMTIAMGETLEKLERFSDALKCYWKAGFLALTKLAALYEKLGEKEKAAAAYSDFISRVDHPPTDQITQTATNATELAVAYKFISSYYFELKNYDEAYKSAEKCTMFPETRDHGKTLCTQILKAKASASTSPNGDGE